MAKFTRADLRRILGEAHTEDIENQIVALHLGVVDPLKDQIATYKNDEAGRSSDPRRRGHDPHRDML